MNKKPNVGEVTSYFQPTYSIFNKACLGSGDRNFLASHLQIRYGVTTQICNAYICYRSLYILWTGEIRDSPAFNAATIHIYPLFLTAGTLLQCLTHMYLASKYEISTRYQERIYSLEIFSKRAIVLGRTKMSQIQIARRLKVPPQLQWVFCTGIAQGIFTASFGQLKGSSAGTTDGLSAGYVRAIANNECFAWAQHSRCLRRQLMWLKQWRQFVRCRNCCWTGNELTWEPQAP